jgi:polysaccharide export outer membrane protein
MLNTDRFLLKSNPAQSALSSGFGSLHVVSMKNPFITLFALIFMLATTSCVPTKKMIYLQTEEGQNTETFKYDRQEYKLQENDILDVQIRSMNPEINALFSPGAAMNQNMQAGVQSGGDLYYMTGYSVNEEGAIELPFVGKINVQGQTLEEAKASVTDEVSKMFKSFHLQVKLGGIRYSALGEFRSPGKKVILQNQATIFEAIAASGDLTQVANRNEVRLIRQYPDGTKIHTINLLDQSIISSPYYFIQPNDVLYAEPLPQKSWGVGITGAQTLSTIVSTLSTSLALTLSIISLTR